MAAAANFFRKAAFTPKARDIIAPAPARHVRHFRPVLSGGGIIDAEYEEIAADEAPRAVKRESILRYGTGCERTGIFGRRFGTKGVGSKKKGSAGFTAATVALSLLSFWISGGHAAVARLFVFAQR